MDVSKLTAQDAETLAEFKRTKAPLGVIHPVHAMVKRPEAEGTPDLTVTATPMKPSIKPQTRVPLPDHLLRSKPQVSSPRKPPEGHLAPKNFMPGFKRPKSAKEQREVQSVASQILASLPMQVKKQAMHRKLSILTKKDTRTSTEEYLGKVRRNLNKKTAKKLLKEDVRRDGGQVMAALDNAFTHLSVSETQYQAARTELEDLVDTIENQLWKEKTLSRFIHKTQVGEVTVIKLKRLLHQQQVEREGSLIAMQRLLYGLRQWKTSLVDLGPGGLTFTFEDLEVFLQENTGKMTPEDRNGVSLYLDKLTKYLRKQAVVKAVELIPMSILEKMLEDLFNKWDGERIIIEGVIHDIENAISQEEHLRSEMRLGSGNKDLELKVVAEFINQYFDKLEESIQKKKEGIQRILEQLKSGKEKPEAWAEIIRKMKETVENEDLEREWTLLNKEAELLKKQENRKKSPKNRAKTTPEKSRKQPDDAVKSNVGRNTKPFLEEDKAKVEVSTKVRPIQTTEPKDLRFSFSSRNPLDSMTALPTIDAEVEDAINILNPSKKPEPAKPLESAFRTSPRPGETQASVKISIPSKEPKEPKSQESILRADPKSGETSLSKTPMTSFFTKMKQPQEDSKLAELRALKEMSPFQSIDLSVSKRKANGPNLIEARIAEIEAKRSTRKGGIRVEEKAVETDKTRFDLIESGERPFSSYLDESGNPFNPDEKFQADKESLRNHIDPRFVEEMVKQTPDSQSSWYIRPHHLKSVTYHPWSISDNPEVSRYQNTFGPAVKKEEKEDVRDSAVGYLERTVEDLKCELDERKRKQAAGLDAQWKEWNRKRLHRIVKPQTKEKLVVSTYESILDELRSREEELLNVRRVAAYETHRPPQEGWYQLKSHEFSKELHRNMMSLKVSRTQPNDANRKLLNTLAISDLY